jgi:hypothetical protein
MKLQDLDLNSAGEPQDLGIPPWRALSSSQGTSCPSLFGHLSPGLCPHCFSACALPSCAPSGRAWPGPRLSHHLLQGAFPEPHVGPSPPRAAKTTALPEHTAVFAVIQDFCPRTGNSSGQVRGPPCPCALHWAQTTNGIAQANPQRELMMSWGQWQP